MQIEEQFKRDWAQAEKSEMIISTFVPSSKESSWSAAICDANLQYVAKNISLSIYA